jgi:flagellar P-ring protein precursor FlgI
MDPCNSPCARWFRVRLVLLVAVAALVLAAPVGATRIKDIATIDGVRSNQLVGYGLVVGLDGTGDRTTQAPFTGQSLENMLTQFGVTIPPDVRVRVANVAAVMVTADLPAFARPGQEVDVTVSSIANADSLRGGTLVMTPLKGADGGVYAMAQGNLIVGGLDAEGDDGSRITVNVPSVGRIPGGATVERKVRSGLGAAGPVTLNLNEADFTTATRITSVINEALGSGTAEPVDAGAVRVDAPSQKADRIPFIAALETLEVTPGEAPARVIVSARTGTVIIGQQVEITPAAVSHGSLVVRVTERPQVSQPGAFSEGETVAVPRSQVEVTQEGRRMFEFDPGVTLQSLVDAVNRVGAAPGDLVAILQGLKKAGALHAELVVI